MSLQERLLTQMTPKERAHEGMVIEIDSKAVKIDKGQTMDIVPAFAISLAEAKDRVTMMQEFVKDMMVPGQDYGMIPA
ncbi:MAG: hypothetical protein PHP26_04820 [Syntrophomonas sp.]|nr:hypothetical protein [Syntrophomonas sp.]